MLKRRIIPKLLLKDGDKATAAEHLRTSITAAPHIQLPKTALDELGPFSTRLAAARRVQASDLKAALVEARIAVALEPKNAVAAVLLGDLYAKSGDKTKAAAAYEQALTVEPDNASAKAGLGKVTTNGK